MNSNKITEGRVYLIGLDGFNPALFGKLEREGVIPNLSRLIKDGVSGPLRSTIPPYTGPAWVSMFTGVNPGRHGIFGFTGRRSDGYEDIVLNASYIKEASIWEYLNKQDLTVGVFNVPFTYPPGEVNGFLVSGMLTPSPEADFTYPPRLKNDIADLVEDYIIDVDLDLERDSRNNVVLQKLKDELECKKKILLALLDEYDPDFLMTVFVLPDRIQHLWWKLLMEEENWEDNSSRVLRKEIYELFFRLDEIIGAIRDRLSKEDVILIASDHGFTSFQRTFYLNNWLKEAGYLRLKRGGELASTLFRILNMSPVKKFISRFIKDSGRSGSARQIVDWEKTAAYASAPMEEGIFINLRGREPEGQVGSGADYDSLRNEIRERLMKLRSSRGRKIFTAVLDREEIYRGDYLSRAPDLLLIFSEAGRNISRNIPGKILWKDWSGSPLGLHQEDGIWAAAGGGIQASPEPVEAHITDISPTILNLFKLPSPSVMDGSPITEVVDPILSRDREIDRGPAGLPLNGLSPSEEAVMKRKLEGLGYI